MDEAKTGDPSINSELKIQEELLSQLPEIAVDLIDDEPENARLKANPDDPAEHEPKWHQFGIITHSRKFCEFYRSEAKGYFEKWDVSGAVNHQLGEIIDGKTKDDLLQLSMPLHDLGKFARGLKEEEGKRKPDYKGHEAKSEKIILENPKVHNLLKEKGLSESQIEYIARCAGLHYELGKMRDAAKKSEMGFTIEFSKSADCEAECRAIAREFPEFAYEVGILFLCDSLAKTDVKRDASSDEEILAQKESIAKELEDRDLNPALAAAAEQRAVNIAIAKKYLETIAEAHA